jgi:thioredoxin 1
MHLPEVTTETFSQQVLESPGPVLVDFWGLRCQPCLALMPAVEALAEENAERLKVVKVNAGTRSNLPLCREQGVMGLPAYLLFKNGKVVRRLTGPDVTRQLLAETIQEFFTQEESA